MSHKLTAKRKNHAAILSQAAAEMGRKGGQATSAKKLAAQRKNIAKARETLRRKRLTAIL